MIDASTARVLGELQVRKAELMEAYTPGFTPGDGEVSGERDKFRASNNPLSSVAPPDSYFIERDAYGRTFYARDGDFQIVDGRLRTPNGSAVTGLSASGEQPLEPLGLDPVDVALGRVQRGTVRIDTAGRLSYIRRIVDPTNGSARDEQVVAGTIALARFPAGTQLNAADGVHATAPAGVQPIVAAPGTVGLGGLLVGYDDHGSVDPKKTLAAIRDAYVQYDALRSAQYAHGKTDKTVMDLVK